MLRTVQCVGKWLTLCTLFLSFPLLSFAQSNVSGKVTDSDGAGLVGATILVKGTTQGVLSDGDGNFVVEVPDANASLAISYLGYRTQVVALTGRSTINVSLERDVANLDEVIITGYTAQSKRDVTGAVTSVNAEQLQEVPSADLASQLQGRAAGVMVGQDSRPGGSAMVRIRGFGSINNNDPLYVIDGVPTTGGLQQINPANIESMQILKDASAASIYGARAANGVVIITTKRGGVGAPKVTFNARYGIQQATNKLDLLGTQGLGELLYNAQRNDYIAINGNDTGFEFNNGQYGANPNDADFIPDYVFPSGAFEGDPGTEASAYSASEPFNLITRANKEGTDWYDEIFDPAPLQEYNVGISGGSQTNRYFLGVNYFNQEGIVQNTGFERFSVRANSQFSPKKWLRVGENIEISHSRSRSFTNNSEGNIVALAYRMQPIVPVLDIAGNYAGNKGTNLGNADNPVAQSERSADNLGQNWRIFGSVFAEADIMKDLTFKTQFGVDYGNFFSSNYSFRNIEASEPSAANSLNVNFNYGLTWTWYNTLTYEKEFADIHKLRVLAGTEAIENIFQDLGGARTNFFSDNFAYRVLNAGGAGITNYNGRSEWALWSTFGKINYTLKDRYLVDVTVRRDASSRFGSNSRVGIFPAASVGWRVSEESFLANVNAVTDAKVRVGWGQMGSQFIDPNNQFTTFGTSLTGSSYDIGGSNSSVVPGFDSQRFGNPDGKWEATTTINAGIDLTLWNALTINVDWYDRRTTDMLYTVTLPGVQGDAAAPAQNVGEMSNTGIDLNLAYANDAMNGDLSYNIGVNFSTYRNEIVGLSLDNENEVLVGPSRRQFTYTRSEAGLPIGYFYGLKIIGFTDSEDVGSGEYDDYYDRPGRFKYEDNNGRNADGDLTGEPDGVIDEADRTLIGSPHPDFTYGLNIDLKYKNFDFSMFWQGVQGNNLINYVRRWTDFFTFQGNRSTRMLEESWTPALGDAALLPELSQSDVLSYQPSTYFVEDGSYLRLKNLQLGYTVPAFGQIDRLRIFVQGTNLVTFTNYSGLDPEVNLQFGNNNMFGFDEGVYPTARTFTIGVNLGF